MELLDKIAEHIESKRLCIVNGSGRRIIAPYRKSQVFTRLQVLNPRWVYNFYDIRHRCSTTLG